MNDAKQTPLTDLLRRVPHDMSVVHESPDQQGTMNTAIGRLMHDAADEIERLRAERDSLRAALIAAMEIVQRERVRIAYNSKGAPPAIEIGYADILHHFDALIAQADAALGSKT